MESAILVPDLAPDFTDGDAAPGAVSERSGLRRRASDFVALTKPRMNFLVVATTGVGYFMAGHSSGLALLIHTILGTALTAAGSSVLNQYIERTLDARMPRTSNRPLPAGRIAPIEALGFGILLSLLGIMQLNFFVNGLTATLAAVTLGTYLFLYTPLKQRSTLCTIVGAVPGALPIVMGWTAVRDSLSPEALALFGIMFFWQMPHFLAIAILYKDDYATGGFQMLPVVDQSGLRATGAQIILYAVALIPVSLLPALFRNAGGLYFTAAILLGLIFAGFGALCAFTRDRAQARQLFLASIAYLPLLLAAMMLDKI